MEKIQKWFEEIRVIFKPDDTTIDSDRNLPDLDLDKIENKINERLSKESGIDRIKELFRYDETIVGGYPEILTETHGLIQGAFVAGFLVGAVAQTKETNEAFKRNTQLTVYVDKKMATRSYIDYVYMQTVKGGLKYGIKYSVFSGIILGSSLLIQAYRNKSNPFDYSAGGAIAGLLLRMHHGLKNGLAGIAVGGLFGTIFGIARYSQLKYTNATYEERRHERLKQKFVLQELLDSRPNEKTNIVDKK